METGLDAFVMAFVPLFVAIDVFGILPIFLGFTGGMRQDRRAHLIRLAAITAFGIAILFLLAGKKLFHLMGITLDDFRVGGGIILLTLSVTDLLFAQPEQRRKPDTSVGIVPIGVPLMMGPAALTTILINTETFGLAVSFASLATNLLIVWIVFRYSGVVIRVLGEGGTRAVSKVANLFLAAIAVMMIRVGIQNLIGSIPG